MASISTAANGHRMVQFTGCDGKRKTVRLGKMPKKTADEVRRRVELLIYAGRTCTAPDGDTAAWVAGISDELHAKLTLVGLVAPRMSRIRQVTLDAFLDAFMEERKDVVKPNTLIVWRQTRRCLVDYFGKDKPLCMITAGDADAWRLHLLKAAPLIGSEKRLSENTVRRRCGFAKQFFRAAVRKQLVDSNPFEGIEGTTVRGNRTRDYFVTRDEAAVILDACPDLEWKLIFALSRFGGLRCPSEHLSLRWGDVDWERQRVRVRVRSPKTEHLPGREQRVMPLFPELRPLLEEAFASTWPKTEASSSSLDTGSQTQICGRSSSAFSSGPACRRGLGCSTTCGRHGRPN